MLLAIVALSLALTGVLWFAWPFLKIRTREAWHRLRGEKGPKRRLPFTRAELEAGARMRVPYGYRAANLKKRRRKAIRKTYKLSGRQMLKLERAVRADLQVDIVKGPNGRGRVRVGGPIPKIVARVAQAASA